MLTVTDSAAKFLAEAIGSQEEDSSQLLRIAFVDGEYALTLDSQRHDDAVIEHAEQGLLIMDPEVSEALAEAVLDVQDTAGGPRLTLSSKP